MKREEEGENSLNGKIDSEHLVWADSAKVSRLVRALKGKRESASLQTFPDALPGFSPSNFALCYLNETTSTMDVAKWFLNSGSSASVGHELRSIYDERLNSAPNAVLVLSETQRQGRGREGREWYSPEACGIYLTFGFRPPVHSLSMSGYSLAVGISLARMLTRLQLDVRLKWPNDVLVREGVSGELRKVAGILVEVMSAGDKLTGMCTGIGLNLYHTDFPSALRATSLEQVIGRRLDYAAVVAELASHYFEVLSHYFAHGFSSFHEEWKRYSIMSGRLVEATQDGVISRFRVTDVDSEGRLIVASLEDGRLSVIQSGEVKLLDTTHD